MKRNKKALTICAVLFIVVGVVQLVLSLTYSPQSLASPTCIMTRPPETAITIA